MKRVLPFLLCAWFLLPSPATAQEPEHDEQWLVELRNSGSYKKGMEQVREKIESMYDKGAVKGAAHEPACAEASKVWSEALLERLRKQVESHGLPAGKKPE